LTQLLDQLRGVGPLGPEAVPALLRLLQRENDGRFQAERVLPLLEAMGRNGRSAVAAVVKLLDDPAAGPAAARAPAAIDPDHADYWGPLLACLRHRNDEDRVQTAQTLGRLGPRAFRAVPALEKALRDENGSVRSAAAAALLRITRDAKTYVPVLGRELLQT